MSLEHSISSSSKVVFNIINIQSYQQSITGNYNTAKHEFLHSRASVFRKDLLPSASLFFQVHEQQDPMITMLTLCRLSVPSAETCLPNFFTHTGSPIKSPPCSYFLQSLDYSSSLIIDQQLDSFTLAILQSFLASNFHKASQ